MLVVVNQQAHYRKLLLTISRNILVWSWLLCDLFVWTTFVATNWAIQQNNFNIMWETEV